VADRSVSVKLELNAAQYKAELAEVRTLTEGLDRSVKDLDQGAGKLSASSGKAGAGLKGMGTEAAGAKKDFAGLVDEIARTRTNIEKLATEYNRTGDRSLFGDIKAQRAHLSLLQSLNKELKAAESAVAGGAGPSGGAAASSAAAAGSPVAGLGPAVGLGAAYLAPMIGAALSAGILSAVGGGALAAGIAAQLHGNPALRAAGGDLAHVLLDEFARASAGLTLPILNSFHALGADLQPFFAELQKGFSALAPYLEPFVHQIGLMMQALGPGLAKAIEASGPVLLALGQALPIIAVGISKFFEQVSAGGKGAAESLLVLARAIASALAVTGMLLRGLSDLFDVFIQGLDKVVGAVAFVFNAAGSHALDPVRNEVHRIATEFDRLKISATDSGDAAADSAAKLNEKLSGTDKLLHQLSDDFDKLLGKQLSVAEANIRYQAAIDALTASIKQNGRTFDDNTAKGRANHQALLDLIKAAEDLRQADIAAGGSVAEANQRFQQQVDAIRRILTQAGLSKQAIDALISSWEALAHKPNIVKTLEFRLSGSALAIAAATGHNPTRAGPAIPAFDEGGMVPGALGSPQLILAHGGEVVVPPQGIRVANSGGGGASPGGVDPAALGRAVAAALVGMHVVLDGRTVGSIQGRQADIYTRTG